MIKANKVPGGYSFVQNGRIVGLLLEAPLCWVAYREEETKSGTIFEVAPFDCRDTLGAWIWILEDHLHKEHVAVIHEIWVRGDNESIEVAA